MDELSTVIAALRDTTLKSPDVADVRRWKERTLPRLRPFLELVSSQLEDPAIFYNPGPMAKGSDAKREARDRFTVKIGDHDLILSVGMGQEDSGVLERSLLWGVMRWGRAQIARERRCGSRS